MFLPCWAGRDHTAAVGLHALSIKADDGEGNLSIVNTEEARDDMNNTGRGAEQKEEGRRRKKGQLVLRLVLVKDD